MLLDAIVLTGGRSSRLDSIPKSEFVVHGSTLLEWSLRAAGDARQIVIVGHEPAVALPVGVKLVREEPPFSGPVCAIAAGVCALLTSTATGEGASGKDRSATVDEAILVLACDMPHIGLAVPFLLRALSANPDTDGALAVDAENRRQPLAAVYRTRALLAALDDAARASGASGHGDPLAGQPMFRLLDHMSLVEVRVPDDSTADVDTWDDAVRLSAHPPHEQAPTTRKRTAR